MKNLFLSPPLISQKVTFVLFLFFTAIFASAQDKYIPKYLTEKDDPLVKDAKSLTQNGWIELKAETSVAPDQFFERYAASLGLMANPHLKLERFSSETSQKGEEHQRYQLYYDGIKVEGLEFLLHAREGKVRSACGKIVSELEINTESRLSEAEAFESTQKAFGMVGSSDDKERLVGELLIARVDIEDFSPKSFVLVYKFMMNIPKETSAFDVYVDAKTGKVLKQIPTAYRCFSPLDGHESFDITKPEDGQATGKAQNLNQPPQAATFIPIKSRYLQGQGSIPFQTELNSFNVQLLGYETYANGMTWPGALTTKKYVNDNLIACYPNQDSPSTQSSKWSAIPQVTNSSTNWQTNHQEATTAHWAVEKTYEYYKNIHNRGGVSTNHGVIGYILTNIPQNAFCGFDGPVYRPFGSQTNYPNGGIGLITIQSFTGESWATLDILAHEYSHGVTRMTSNLAYERESGALNEAFSDIIGYCVERRTLPNDWNWLLGEDVAGAGRAFRNMQDPGSIPFNRPLRGWMILTLNDHSAAQPLMKH